MKAIAQHGYPLSDKAQADLKLVQTHLKLSDADIAQFERRSLPKNKQNSKNNSSNQKTLNSGNLWQSRVK